MLHSASVMFTIASGFFNDNLGAILTLIAAVASAVVSVINGFKGRDTHNRVMEVDDKMNTVQKQTNGDRDRLMLELEKKDLLINQQKLVIAGKDMELLKLNKRESDFQKT